MAIDEKDKKISLLLEDLASFEDYIHDLFIFSPLSICFVSPLGVVLEANPAFEKISNFSLGEIVGGVIESLFEKEEIEKLIKDTFKKGFVEGREMKFFPKGKKSLMAQVFTKVREDEKGKAVGYFLGLFDLTQIKKTEKELRKAQTALLNILEDTEEARGRAEEEKNKTLSIIQNFTDGLLVFDKENRLSLINPQAEKFFDLKPSEKEEIIGKSVLELAKFENLAPLIHLLGKKMKGIFRRDLELEKEFTLEVSTIPMIREEEESGTLVILHDVSREEIIERLKTEFISIAAHQLRTPLSAIKWTLKTLLDGDLGEITKEQREFIKKTYRSNERMISLINSLLNVARIEEGRLLYKPVSSRIDELTESVIEVLKEEIKRKQIEFKFEKPEKLPEVLIDVEKIKFVIQNLIENALRYTLPGGKVTVSLKPIKGEIKFSVKDTGVGIPENQQERVFSKFFRGANVMRLETEGSGLGLFITKNIIKTHGGKIWFESKEEKGTTFHFSLPLKRV